MAKVYEYEYVPVKLLKGYIEDSLQQLKSNIDNYNKLIGHVTPKLFVNNKYCDLESNLENVINDNDCIDLVLYPTVSASVFVGLGLSAFWAGVAATVVNVGLAVGLSYLSYNIAKDFFQLSLRFH